MHTVMHMNTIKRYLSAFHAIHPQTKKLLRFCAGYIACVLLSSGSLFLLAGRGVNYYAAMQLAADLFSVVRPCVGVTVLGGLLFEGALRNAE